MTVAAARRTRNARAQTAPLRFDQRLVLNQWMLSLFEVTAFEQLAEMLKGPDVEGFDADNVSLFHHRLAARRYERNGLSAQQLLEYDE